MCPYAGCFAGNSGNSLLKKGATILERNRIAPAFSPIFMNPKKRVMMPINLKDKSTLSEEDLKIPSVTALRIKGSPVTSHFTKAIAKAIIKKKNQM